MNTILSGSPYTPHVHVKLRTDISPNPTNCIATIKSVLISHPISTYMDSEVPLFPQVFSVWVRFASVP